MSAQSEQYPFSFAGKVAVVTGGASGIGFAIARALAAKGAKVVLADIEENVLSNAAQALRAEYGEADAFRTDVGDRDSVQRLADHTFETHGAAHLLFSNAGVAVFGPTQDMTYADWMWSIQVNLWGPIYGVEAFVPRMIKQGEGGHLVFTASFAGLVPNRDLGPYNVTKAGVVALAESLRKDLKGTGISASVLCPMRVSSNIDQSYRNRPVELGQTVNTYSDEDKSALLGRTLAPEPVADLVLQAICEDRLYIQTHKEAGQLFQRRAERIIASFDQAL